MIFVNRTSHDVSYAGDYASEQDRQEQVRKKVGLSKTNRKPDKGNNGNCHNSRSMKMTYPTKVKDRDFLVRENGIT